MKTLLFLAALAGLLALLRVLVSATMALARQALEGYVLRTLARTRAQSGDLTALTEANQLARANRLRRYRRWGEVLGLAGLLFVPTLTAYAMHIYALYNLFWYIRPHSTVVVSQ